MITSHSSADNCRDSTMDGGGESPLDVLSRAATMIQQETQQATEESTKNLHKQTNKWKRDRRRLPEYSRKSDPKIPETFGIEPSSPEASLSNGINPLGNLNGIAGKSEQSTNGTDTPLDMSVRQRGLPPSYAQTISNPGYRSTYKPTIAQNGISSNRDELPPGVSMCDPVIEEHFRRSLGDDYHMLFSGKSAKDKDPPLKQPTRPCVVELMEDTTLSVDDHFAKALGDTWAKLNKQQDMKNRESESNLVTIKN